MERIFFVKNDELSEVNEWLEDGGRIKHIQAVGEPLHNGGDTTPYPNTGAIYAYIVVEFD